MTAEASSSAPGTTPWVRVEDGGSADATDDRIDTFELVSARRALALLKHGLGRERLLELVRDEIEAGNAVLRDGAARSGGEQRWGTTVLRAHGISAGEFNAWMGAAFDREDVMLAGHPEHYAIHAEPGKGVNIVETLGEHVCSFFMQGWEESADAAAVASADGVGAGARVDARRSRMVLADGTVVGSIATAFDEAPGGFTAQLSVGLPVACDDAMIAQHLEHFAVEFRTWILLAASESG